MITLFRQKHGLQSLVRLLSEESSDPVRLTTIRGQLFLVIWVDPLSDAMIPVTPDLEYTELV